MFLQILHRGFYFILQLPMVILIRNVLELSIIWNAPFLPGFLELTKLIFTGISSSWGLVPLSRGVVWQSKHMSNDRKVVLVIQCWNNGDILSVDNLEELNRFAEFYQFYHLYFLIQCSYQRYLQKSFAIGSFPGYNICTSLRYC
jgi:hypothetical protein